MFLVPLKKSAIAGEILWGSCEGPNCGGNEPPGFGRGEKKQGASELDPEAPAVFHLSTKHIGNQGACFLYFRNGEKAVNLLPRAPSGNHPSRSEHSKMLRQIGLGNPQALMEFGHWTGALRH